MYATYVERQSASYVAEQCGVSRETADRVIKHGYPRHGWAPLRERLTAVHAETARAEDYTLVEANRETLRGLRAYKARFLKEFDATSIEDADVTLATLEKIAKLETFLLGGADKRIAVQANVRHDHASVIAAMPDEMLEEFIKTGKSSIEMDRIAEDVWGSGKR
jgi:hypothetical protein